MKKVFLGGTCNESTWRDKLIPLLEENNINYFNPVVPDWTEECYQEELKQKEICDINLFVITPLMTGVYSIAEVVDLSNKRPNNTIFAILYNDKDENGRDISFDKGQTKSLLKVLEMVRENGAKTCNIVNDHPDNLNALVYAINSIR